jgi:hypothetical protein
MGKLQTLKTIEEDPATVKAACFYVGWKLISADSWAYVSVFTGEHDVVSLEALIKAVAAKKSRLTIAKEEANMSFNVAKKVYGKKKTA